MSRDASCFKIANINSCLRMIEAFSTSCSSANASNSVGRFRLQILKLISRFRIFGPGFSISVMARCALLIGLGIFNHGVIRAPCRVRQPYADRQVIALWRDVEPTHFGRFRKDDPQNNLKISCERAAKPWRQPESTANPTFRIDGGISEQAAIPRRQTSRNRKSPQHSG